MGQVVRVTTPVGYSQTGMFDILIVTVINWIVRTIMGQVTEATHISLINVTHLFLLCRSTL